MRTTMITGSTGFIGSHVVREAERRGTPVRLMSRGRPPAAVPVPRPVLARAVRAVRSVGAAPAAQIVRADLAHPETLRGACEGVDVLLHCASQIGGAADVNEAVNARGTAALVAEAERAGVDRIVYLSTASVYGRGVFQGARPDQLTRRPGSPTSRTRAAAEDVVLAAGGIVLRPHLVYGEGDTWMVPELVRLLRVLRGGAAGWNARMSAISAPELARLLLGAGCAPDGSLTTSVYHAGHPRPVTAAALLRAVADCAALPRSRSELTVAQARERLAAAGWAQHGLDMLATDHWFDSAQLWADLNETPGSGFDKDFAKTRAWYRDLVQAA